MSSLAATDSHATQAPAKAIQPAWVRAMHWTNAVAMILMIMSGWQIYNASPLFGFTFPRSITISWWVSLPVVSRRNCCRSRPAAWFPTSRRR
jgi:thiosulfate reductase cytochrome b subunit